MAYIGKSIESGTFSVLDTSGNTYNGSNTTFSLGTQVGSTAQLLVSHDGVIQKPGTDYSLASGGTQITFSTAPASGASIFIVEISGAVGGPLDSDLNGSELILDTDGDTSITADTDDQIDIKVAGADDFQIVANNFKVLSGSTLTIESGGTITNSGTANNFGTTTIGGLTDVTMDATNFADGLLIQPNSDGSAPTTGTLSTAIENIGIGHNTFSALTSGDYNTAYGSRAGTALTTGSENQLFGKSAGGSITTGQYNHIFGMNAGASFDTESNNVAFGLSALGGSIAGGEQNTVFGNSSGDSITSGDANVIVGYNAGDALTSGGYNTIVGYSAGTTCTTGSTNIAIGSHTGFSATNADQQIVIGYNQTSPGNDTFSFGSGNTNRVYNAFTSNASWTRSSDERLKKDINTNEDCGLDFINDLRTVTFKWKAPSEQPEEFSSYDPEKTEPNHKDKLYGFIAQEVKSVLDKHNITNFNGWNSAKDGDDNDIQGISYEMFVIPLVKSIQELSKKVEDLEKKLEDK